MEPTKGKKNDKGKIHWHSLPLEILEPLAAVFEYGRDYYGKFNCLNSFDNSDERFWDAKMRHSKACQVDPLAVNYEDGNVYHEAQVAFSSLMRLHHAIKEKGHAVDYLKPNTDKAGIPDTGSGSNDSSGASLLYKGESDGSLPLPQRLDLLLAILDRKIVVGLLQRHGFAPAPCNDDRSDGHQEADPHGCHCQEGEPGKPSCCGGQGQKQGSLSGSGKTLGPGFHKSNRTGKAK